MSNPARPLRIVIVSPDTGVLHDLSWMLTAVGYTVVTSKDVGESAAWRQFGETDFVLFDGRSISGPTQATLAHRSDNPVYRIFLYDPAASMDLTAWFAAGANDALRVPVSRGELLARIRAGARILEFENRMRSQSSRSRLPGMYSVRGLLRKLSKFATEGKSVTLGHTLITTSIDFFAGLCREEGESAARSLLAALAKSIQHNASGQAIAAYIDDGTFQVLLPGRTAAAARVIAEQVAHGFRAAQVDRESRARLSVTTAIVPWRVGVSSEQLLEQGQETLSIAKQSGGDCAIEQNEFAQELSSWQNELAAGSPFANVIAQDIMEPFPAVLDRDSANQAMLAALRRSGAPVWPFVDREGRLVGVASPAPATDAFAAWEPNSKGGEALTQPVTIAHNAAFPEIYEAFSTQGCLIMVVVAEHRPIGYLTCSGFLSLIEPINSATFSSDEPSLDDSRSLLVGSLVNEFELASGTDQ
ncbi:MAG TPA: diguanylate cyclase [Pirellulales bacterium]|jgi:GGDEF domain-containing protein|nr:diguanylate cyclase [Pirellulales bacterium]